MLGFNCFCWSRDYEIFPESHEPEPFVLPSSMPEWPPGEGFATRRICLGELEVQKVIKFQKVWSCILLKEISKGATFYKPSGVPDGFFCLGHYGQPNNQPLRGFVLVARKMEVFKSGTPHSIVSSKLFRNSQYTTVDLPPLEKPINYTLVWSTDEWTENPSNSGYFWLPCPPEGYKAMGYVVTNSAEKPSLEEVRCVRSDLTETCETQGLILNVENVGPKFSFHVWHTRPCQRGMWGQGLSIGTFVCSTDTNSIDNQNIACLKNLNPVLHTMPNLNQIHALIKHYGPTIFFHPNEIYLPSSVQWFFENGALLYKKGSPDGEPIDTLGSNLPKGGSNDGEYWIDLPDDKREKCIKFGNIESAELYVHVKPALGGTFTDIVMWVFCPFNGPGTLKIGMVNLALSKIGQHVGDWEHFTLRVSNFTGELWGIYFSQHSGGEWVNTWDLEFIEGSKAVVYSSRNGHASFPHPGNHLQGSKKLGIGVRNDAEKSDFFVDSSLNYRIVAAEYLGDGNISEPCWLQFMREWGPTIVYNSRAELEKIIRLLPVTMRFSVENIIDKFPVELYGEEGPTGPKEKNNWEGDERGILNLLAFGSNEG